MAEPIPLHRKLAAILAADIVAYSRLMEADEVGTLRQVRRIQATCIDPLAAAHGGRLIKSTGDGFLFELASARDATLFGLALQKKVQADMVSMPEDKRLMLRAATIHRRAAAPILSPIEPPRRASSARLSRQSADSRPSSPCWRLHCIAPGFNLASRRTRPRMDL